MQGWQDSQRAVPTRIQRQAPAQPRAQPRCRAEPHQPARPVGRWAPGAARRPTSASLSSSQSLAPSGYARTPPCAENASRSAISASSAPKRQAPGRPVHEACPGFNLNLDGVKTHADQYETGTSCLWRRSGSGGRTSSPATLSLPREYPHRRPLAHRPPRDGQQSTSLLVSTAQQRHGQSRARITTCKMPCYTTNPERHVRLVDRWIRLPRAGPSCRRSGGVAGHARTQPCEQQQWSCPLRNVQP